MVNNSELQPGNISHHLLDNTTFIKLQETCFNDKAASNQADIIVLEFNLKRTLSSQAALIEIELKS